MANKILHKRSAVSGKMPLATQLDLGELAINLVDEKLYMKNAAGVVVEVSSDLSNYLTETQITDALSTKVDNTRVLTDVPAGALFTDTNTMYSPGTGITFDGTTISNAAPHEATNLGSSGTGDTRTITSSTGTETSFTYSAADVGAEPAFIKATGFNKPFGTTAGTVTEGNDARLSDARTPTAHDHDDLYHTKVYLDAELGNISAVLDGVLGV